MNDQESEMQNDKNINALDVSSNQVGQMPDEKNKLIHFRFFCGVDFITCMGFAYMRPFFPQLASQEAGLMYSMVGLTYTVGALGNIGFSIPLGKLVTYWGKIQKKFQIEKAVKNLCSSPWLYKLSCYFQVEFCNIVLVKNIYFQLLLQQLDFFKECAGKLTTLTTLLLRAQFKISEYAYINAYWPGEFQLYFSKAEVWVQLGFLIGPVLGSLLNFLLGFALPLFLYAISILLLTIYFLPKIPSDDELNLSELRKNKKKESIKLKDLMKAYKIIILLLVVLTTLGSIQYQTAFLMNHLESFGINQNLGALVIVTPSIFGVLLIQQVPKLQKYFLKQFTIFISIILCITGLSIEGPIWGVANGPTSVLIGVIFIGSSLPFLKTPIIPLYKEQLDTIMINKENVNEMASSFYTMGTASGNLIMPLLGGVIYDSFGGDIDPNIYITEERKAFRFSLLTFTCIQLTILLLFIFFADGYQGLVDIFQKITGKKAFVQKEEEQLLLEKEEIKVSMQQQSLN